MSRYDFFAETYDTERLKTLSVWVAVAETDLDFRIEPRARTPIEHMVHQCQSEDLWMRTMLGIAVPGPVLPEREDRIDFVRHYAEASERRLEELRTRPDGWFEEETDFFATSRSRAWVLLRRIAHSAHHRGQLTAIMRSRGAALHSTYGPTADTGGLFQNGAGVVYQAEDIDRLLEIAEDGRVAAPLPGPGALPVTERPGRG